MNYQFSAIPDYFGPTRPEIAILHRRSMDILKEDMSSLRNLLEETALYYREEFHIDITTVNPRGWHDSTPLEIQIAHDTCVYLREVGLSNRAIEPYRVSRNKAWEACGLSSVVQYAGALGKIDGVIRVAYSYRQCGRQCRRGDIFERSLKISRHEDALILIHLY